MSVIDEKLRSIAQIRTVVYAMCFSKHNKIHPEWRKQIYYCFKHFPALYEIFIMDGIKQKKLHGINTEECKESSSELTKMIDDYIDKQKKKPKGKKKNGNKKQK